MPAESSVTTCKTLGGCAEALARPPPSRRRPIDDLSTIFGEGSGLWGLFPVTAVVRERELSRLFTLLVFSPSASACCANRVV